MRDHRQLVERFQAALFPLHGLPPSWPGPRHLGGWAGSWSKRQRPVTTALSLGHGDPLADQGPRLRVAVSVERVDGDPGMPIRFESRRSLAEDLWLQAAPTAADDAERWDRIAAARSRPDPGWSRVTIPVDGRPVAFAWLAEGRHWVARAELDDRTLTLHARDLPVGSPDGPEHPTATVDDHLPWMTVRAPDVHSAVNVLGRRRGGQRSGDCCRSCRGRPSHSTIRRWPGSWPARSTPCCWPAVRTRSWGR